VSNSTDTYWSVNGVSLQTYAFNIETLASKFKTPPLRGSDRVLAYRHGAQHRDRKFDSQSLQLGMWVIGADENGGVPAYREMQFRANMKKLQGLFVSPYGREFTITKRWQDTQTGLVIAATGHGLCPDGLDPAMEGGPYRAKVVADVFMADPFFYGDPLQTTIPLNTPTTIQVLGDVPTSVMKIDYYGQLSNALLTNSTPNPDVWIKTGTALALGDSMTVDVGEATAVRTSDSANLIGSVTHSGSREWFVLQPGTNTVTLTTDIGAGHAVLTYTPIYY
jgi:hypothetical protein